MIGRAAIASEKKHSRKFFDYLLAAILGTGILASLVYLTFDNCYQKLAHRSETSTNQVRDNSRSIFDALQTVAHGMQVFYHSSIEVDADQFRLISEKFFAVYSHIRATLWAPRVDKGELSGLSEQAEKEWHLFGFTVKEFDSNGNLRTLSQRPVFFPTVYREPRKGENLRLIGWDLNSPNLLARAVKKAVRTGKPVVSVPQTIGEGFQELSYILVATYKGKQVPRTSKLREIAVTGILGFAIDTEAMLGSVYSEQINAVDFFLQGDNAKSQLLMSVGRQEKSLPWHAFRFKTTRDLQIGVNNISLAVEQYLLLDENDWMMLTGASSLGLTLVVGLLLLVNRSRVIQKYADEINDINVGLEIQVEKRTKELQKKTAEVKAILDSLNQGIFAILENVRIGPQYSRHLEKMLQSNDIAYKDAVDLIFEPLIHSRERLSDIKCLLDSMIGGDYFNFKFNQHLLPREICSNKENVDRIYELDYTPITDEYGSLDKIIVAMRDVTTMRRLHAGT